MAEKLLRETLPGGVALFTLNRPQSLNAIDIELATLLHDAFAAIEADENIRAVILTGAGNRAFCSGFDIHEMAGMSGADLARAYAARDPLFWLTAAHSRPIIAAVNGIAYGAGALIAAAADIRIGCPAMKFRVTATSYGGANATWTLPPIIGIARAKEILMTGRVVGGEEALAIGLINRLERDSGTVAAAIELATVIAANPPPAVQAVKRLVNAAVGRSLEEAYHAEFNWMSANLSSAPGGELFDGFLKNHPPKN
jgi:enoyl-CoA hydratase/carnithine racemase